MEWFSSLHYVDIIIIVGVYLFAEMKPKMSDMIVLKTVAGEQVHVL